MWVDRQTFPGQPLFNEETEGCLPMEILLADSRDLGRTWSDWRVVSVPADVGPPSLTNPVLVLPSGRLALSIETNKTYEDRGPWLQRVVYLYSEDRGRTWGGPVTTCQDPAGRIFHWDQRAGVFPDGRLATFTWTYDRQTTRYLNIRRRLSADEGAAWSAPEDLGFADQAAHPAILPDGRVVLAWVDRFGSRSIRARLATAADAPFDAATEVELYRQTAGGSPTAAGHEDTGELLAGMGLWSFGLPFAAALPDGGRHGRLLRRGRFLHGGALGASGAVRTALSTTPASGLSLYPLHIRRQGSGLMAAPGPVAWSASDLPASEGGRSPRWAVRQVRLSAFQHPLPIRLIHPERSGPAGSGAGRSPGAGTSPGRSAADARGR